MLSCRNIKRIHLGFVTAAGLLCAGAVFAQPRGHGDSEADLLWRKSIEVGAETPMRADMTITERILGATTRTTAHVVQSEGGRYRVVFSSPPDAQGRVVASDGAAFWTFDPKLKLLVKYAQVSGTGQGARRTDPLVERNYRIALLSDRDSIAGRPVYVLALVPRLAGKSSQRRWIDRRTFKTLRIETRYADGVVARVIAYSNVELPAHVARADVAPPATTGRRLEDRTTPAVFVPASDLPIRVRELGLGMNGPLGFHLMQITSSAVGGKENLQLLYGDGVGSISIFAQLGGRTPRTIPVDWRRTSIHGTTAFTETTGHTNVVVWSASGHRFTVISHLAPDALQTFLMGLVK